jgi:hypothetical protein
MANRDYPLAPTFKPGPGKPKKTPVNFNPPSVKKESTPKEMSKPASKVKPENVLENYRMKGVVSKSKLPRESGNSCGPSKKSM